MLYIYLIIFKDNCINSNNFSAIDLIIYYRSIIDLKIEFKIQILYIISSLVVSVQSSMNISSIPHVDRMSNIYNNSMVRFYHHVIHDLAGMGNNSPIFFFFFLSKLYIYILILWFFFFLISDPRTKDWFLIPSPVPGITILIGYLYFILSWGPKHMENRKPYQLKNILICYNFLQILLSFWLFYEGLDAAWLRKYSWKCQSVDFSNSPEALRVSSFPFLFSLSFYIFFFHLSIYLHYQPCNNIKGLYIFFFIY